MHVTGTRPGRVRWAAVTVSAMALILTLTTASASAAVAKPDPSTTLKNAAIPASCGHAATTLDGYEKDFGVNGGAWLRVKQAINLKMGHKSHPVIVVPFGCTAGGVGWPEWLLTYSRGGRLIGSVDLARSAPRQEHQTVTILRPHHGELQVRFIGTDGCCYAKTTHRGVLSFRRGKFVWQSTRALTVDYGSDIEGDDWPELGRVHQAKDANLFLSQTPRAFRDFIRHRWKRLHGSATGTCADGATVYVYRFSHKGFAAGAEDSCTGAGYIWARVRGKWQAVALSQDYYSCGAPGTVLRRAVTALAEPCVDGNGKVHKLGHWPRSGE